MTGGNGAERERIAAIDVGSNSVRLLVAEYDPASGLTVIDELKDQPRLAAGLARTGCLDEAAMDRAIQTLGRMREVCQRRNVRRIAAVATVSGQLVAEPGGCRPSRPVPILAVHGTGDEVIPYGGLR